MCVFLNMIVNVTKERDIKDMYERKKYLHLSCVQVTRDRNYFKK